MKHRTLFSMCLDLSLKPSACPAALPFHPHVSRAVRLAMRRLFLVWLGVSTPIRAQISDAPEMSMQSSRPIVPWRVDETKEQRDARMAWWREAKFGMFIHWGPYAVYGAVYEGKPYPTSEWLYERAKIPVASYRDNARRFHPDSFDAQAWVQLAKRAGQKYIIITAKHHDGFALWPSQHGDFNLQQSSGFARDPLAELAAACRKEGIRLGFYYSQALDFTQPGGGKSRHGAWDPAQNGDFDAYWDRVAIPQVRELLTRYGAGVPAVLWFDVSAQNMNPSRTERMLSLVRQHPQLIINNRLSPIGPGDYSTPERDTPPRGFRDRDWEAALMTHNTWGFTSHDEKWKSSKDLLRQLIDAASKGGNVLLNVAPDAHGVIPAPAVERLEALGSWLKINGESIYGSGPTCFGTESSPINSTNSASNAKRVTAWKWRCTTKPGRIYVHLLDWPTKDFSLPPVSSRIEKVYLLADPTQQALEFATSAAGTRISLPQKAPDAVASVLCVKLTPTPPSTSGNAPD